MKCLSIMLLIISAIGCAGPEDPEQEPPVTNPGDSATPEILPVDSQPAPDPPLDLVATLKRLDAVLEMDDEGNVLSLTASGPMVVDEVLEQIGMLTSLVTLNLEYTEITDAGLAHLAGLGSIKKLILRGTEITDAGLAMLETLITLTELDVEFAAVTDEGVNRLQNVLPKCTINH
ncbi:MAG: hypothetical protein VX715_03260 [Planctomycetota bacterium]|nr:hypothetical protein [Planctomycetota bacterium]